MRPDLNLSMVSRLHPRVPLRARCWCEADRVTFYAPVVNISEGGLFIRTFAPLEEGSAARVSFSLDGSPIELSGRVIVIWANRTEGPAKVAGMGLRFVDLDEESALALHAFVERVRADPAE